jgi:hypothetical protein
MASDPPIKPVPGLVRSTIDAIVRLIENIVTCVYRVVVGNKGCLTVC